MISMIQMIMRKMDYCIGNLFEGSQSKQVAKSSSLSSTDSWLELAMEEESEESVMERVEASNSIQLQYCSE